MNYIDPFSQSSTLIEARVVVKSDLAAGYESIVRVTFGRGRKGGRRERGEIAQEKGMEEKTVVRIGLS